MPDSEGFLLDDEVMVLGSVWKVKDASEGLLCEEEDCPSPATVELTFDEEECFAWKCLCEQHFEEFKAQT